MIIVKGEEIHLFSFITLLSYSHRVNYFYDKIESGGASVRRTIYSWCEANMVIPSKEPLASLGVEVVRLDLSVDKQEFEP